MWFRSWFYVLGIGTQPRRSRSTPRPAIAVVIRRDDCSWKGSNSANCWRFFRQRTLPSARIPWRWSPPTRSASRGHSGDAESANINGFQYPGTIGADLAEVYANSNENAWMLTLHGVAYSHDYYYYDGGSFYWEEYITRVGGTSADFEFFGPDAGVLNELLSQQLVGGFFELRNGYQDGSVFADDNGPYRYLELGLSREGVSFYVNGAAWGAHFSADEQGYPVLEPQLLWTQYSTITDFRPGNSGGLVSFGDLVHIGSAGPSTPTPPVAADQRRDGHGGQHRHRPATFTVTLSAASTQAVTVAYATGQRHRHGRQRLPGRVAAR